MRIDHDKILNMWAEGKEAFTIACAVGCSWSHIASLVSEYRKQGDPRAIKRKRGEGLRDAIPNNIKVVQRMKKFRRYPTTPQVLTELIQSYSGPITKCPLGFHAGHRPKCLASIGL
jgi:hypothetical protein